MVDPRNATDLTSGHFCHVRETGLGGAVIADGEVSSRQVMSLQRYSRHASALNFRAPFLDGHPASSTDISAETRAIGRCPQAAAGRPLDIGLAIASMGADHE